MKLYNLNREDYFIITGDVLKNIYRLETLDGIYSRCFDEQGNLHHFSVGTPVTQVNKEYKLKEELSKEDISLPRSHR